MLNATAVQVIPDWLLVLRSDLSTDASRTFPSQINNSVICITIDLSAMPIVVVYINVDFDRIAVIVFF